MDWSLLLDKSILIFIIFLVSLGIAAYATYGERKVAAFSIIIQPAAAKQPFCFLAHRKIYLA